MSDHHVRVTDTGEMQVTVEGVTFPPLPLDAVQAMAAKIPDAAMASASRAMTEAVRALTDVLVTAGPDAAGTIEFTASTVVAGVDEGTYDLAMEAFGVEPDTDGDLRAGPVIVRKRPSPKP